MDEQTAKRVSMDFQLPSNERPSSLLGVASRQVNENTGVVVYHLVTGLSIKLDPRKNTDSVTIMSNA
mgnify:CR=1 FL=1